MKGLFDWLTMLAIGAVTVVFLGFVFKGYYLLFMLGWGVL